MKRQSPIIGVLLLLACVQCTFNRDEEDIILTEDLIYVSSETARFSGRILESINSIDDHGFQLSASADFGDPQFISLSEKSAPGLFVGEAIGLNSNTSYFFRAYMSTSNGMLFGDPKSFTTLLPNALDFEPKITVQGGTVTISGANVTSDAVVYFGDTKAEILDVQFESNIVVRVPQIESEVRVPVSVEMIEETFELDTFEFVTGLWTIEESDFLDELGANFYQAASAQTNSNFVFGLGFDNTLFSSSRLFELDFGSWTWTEQFFFGQASRDPFVSGSYFGGGTQLVLFGGAIMNNEFWQLTTSGLTSLGNIPFEVYKGIAAEVNNDLYVYGGFRDNENFSSTVQKYDGVNWTMEGSHPVTLYNDSIPISSDLPHFTIDNETYVIYEGHVRRFDLNSMTFEIYDEAPFFNCLEGAQIVMNNKFYVGICGGTEREFYEYDPAKKVWREKTRFFATDVEHNVACFVHDETIYFLINPTLEIPTQVSRPTRLYSFKPDAF